MYQHSCYTQSKLLQHLWYKVGKWTFTECHTGVASMVKHIADDVWLEYFNFLQRKANKKEFCSAIYLSASRQKKTSKLLTTKSRI